MITHTGKINSIQSLGALDGPGIRFVVFTQGCNLKCGCCHNPDTWSAGGGMPYTAAEIAEKAMHYREYFGEEGGITISGGEPLLQAEFAREVFELCRKEGINTCLDTSGSILNAAVKELLRHTDRVLLDIKYTNAELYRRHVDCDISRVTDFLCFLNENGIKTTLRQVIIPTLNDTEENISELAKIIAAHSCIDKYELLPFKKLCQVKYDKLSIPFPFAHIPEPSEEEMRRLEEMLSRKLCEVQK